MHNQAHRRTSSPIDQVVDPLNLSLHVDDVVSDVAVDLGDGVG